VFKSNLTPEQFAAWLVKANPGEQIVYGVGSYIPANKPKIAVAARSAHEARQIHLVQKRIERNVCEYIAIRASIHFGQLDKKRSAGR